MLGFTSSFPPPPIFGCRGCGVPFHKLKDLTTHLNECAALKNERQAKIDKAVDEAWERNRKT